MLLLMRIRREPALFWIGLVGPSSQALTAILLVHNPTFAGLVNAAAAGLAGAVAAVLVRSDGQVAAITGAAQTVLALLVGLGLGWTSEQQALLLVPIGMVAAYLVRDRVTGPVPAIQQ